MVRLQKQVLDKYNELRKIVKDNFDVNVSPTITYDLNSVRIAGQYSPKYNTIRLNKALLEQYKGVYIDNTFVHEFAHSVVDVLYPYYTKPHGKEFKKVCRVLGIEGKARTNLYSDASFSKTKELFSYTCSCGYDHKVTKVIHNKIQRGQQRICTICNTTLKKA